MASYLHEWSLRQVVEYLPPLNGESEPESEQLSSSTRKRVRSTSAPPYPVPDDVRKAYKEPLKSDINVEEDDSIPRTKHTRYNIMHFKNWVTSLDSTKSKIFHDPVHGTIELHPLLVTIINTHVFDRLKDIKQLGGVYYVYPGATHSRFEHSLGTCFIAGEYVQMLKRKQPELGITNTDVLHVQIAALCHDLGHGPFSKLFKKEVLPNVNGGNNQDNLKVPKLSGLILKDHVFEDQKVKEEFRRYGLDNFDIEIIREVIDHAVHESSNPPVLHTPKQTFLCEIVANKDTGIDVCKWDFLARDCHYLGIPNEFDWRRLMALSRVIKVNGEFKICYRNKAINNIYGMFRTRCNLHERVYKHHTVVAVEHMIGDAITKAMDSKGLIELQSPTESSANRLEPITIREAIKKAANDISPDLKGYLTLSDSIVPLILNASDNGDGAYHEETIEMNEGQEVQANQEAPSEVRDHRPNPETEQTTNEWNSRHIEVESGLKKAKKILWRLKQRDLLQLIDEIDTTAATEVITEKDLVFDSEYEHDSDIYITTVHISYDSERKVKEYNEQDPVKRVYFYDKATPWEARCQSKSANDVRPSSKRSNFVIPKTFVSRKTRLYASRNKSKEDIKHLREWFKDKVNSFPTQSNDERNE